MKYKVEVTLTAKKTFTYEIEAASERRATDKALDKAIDEFASNPPTETEDDFDSEVVQLTQDCEECDTEYVVGSDEQFKPYGEYCAKCGPKAVAEETAKR